MKIEISKEDLCLTISGVIMVDGCETCLMMAGRCGKCQAKYDFEYKKEMNRLNNSNNTDPVWPTIKCRRCGQLHHFDLGHNCFSYGFTTYI